jgi:sterol desaturase/sphingolipid hydroxylase (fatty acid hydroxylase superfamily)
LRPKRTPQRAHVWSNFGLFVTNTILARLVGVGSIVAVAANGSDRGWGLFSWLTAPAWFEFLIAIVALDFGMYVQHRLFHWVPWLWRLHAVHHSDVEIDVTTGVRFHVGEALTSFVLKGVAVTALGASVPAVLTFEVLLSTAALFTHTNVRIHPALDAAMRRLLVTPDMHRVHHSVEYDEHNSNFGFFLIWWDRLFGSYQAMPRADLRTMPIGLSEYRNEVDQKLPSLLIQPFRTSQF